MTDHRPDEHNRGARGLPAADQRPGGYDGYDAALRGAAVIPRGRRGLIAIAGTDAVHFLHGILTNDIRGLRQGNACYSAYLTPQGRMVCDMYVLRRDDDVLLDVEPSVRERLVKRLDESLFTEDVRIVDRSEDIESVAILGPEADRVIDGVLRRASGEGLPVPLDPDRHVTIRPGGEGEDLLILRTDTGAFDVFTGSGRAGAIVDRALAAGAVPLGDLAAESLRIEAGVPVFGIDMTEETIPLEAGIEGRAISMTKGCYVGQEVIVRILHRGGGRVAKRLVGLRVDGHQAPAAGARLSTGEREVGSVTSGIVSPRFGPIALGYVHRDFAEPGVRLALDGDSLASATVSSLPFEIA